MLGTWPGARSAQGRHAFLICTKALMGWWQSWAELAETIRHCGVTVFHMRKTDQTFPVGSVSGATYVRCFLSVSLSFFLPCHGACRILVPQPEIESASPTVES